MTDDAGLTISLKPNPGGFIDAHTLGRTLLLTDKMLHALARSRDPKSARRLSWAVTTLMFGPDGEVIVRITPANKPKKEATE